MNVLDPNETAAELLRWIGVLSRHARRAAHSAACAGAPAALPGVAWLLLHSVRARPGQTVSGLARGTGLSKSRVSVVVDQLQSLGLVDKRADPADQRVVRLYCSPREPESCGAAQTAYVRAMAELVGELQPEERQALLRALRRMGQAAEAKVSG